MKLSIAIASENALPNAFVVFRGFNKSIRDAAALGYDGVELALKNADEVNPLKIKSLLRETGLQVSCISTGQVFAESGLMFTDEDIRKRIQVKKVFRELIDLATDLCPMVNIGRIRGKIGNHGTREGEERFIEVVRELCDYAALRKVCLVLEPVNRYEINFVNSVEEGVTLLQKVNHPNLKLMPDLFHMNIEDAKIGEELSRNIEYIGYVHLADSNRLAPGWGHTDFHDIFKHLRKVKYNGWLAVEILPKPEPFAAAKQAIDFLKPFLNHNAHINR